MGVKGHKVLYIYICSSGKQRRSRSFCELMAKSMENGTVHLVPVVLHPSPPPPPPIRIAFVPRPNIYMFFLLHWLRVSHVNYEDYNIFILTRVRCKFNQIERSNFSYDGVACIHCQFFALVAPTVLPKYTRHS